MDRPNRNFGFRLLLSIFLCFGCNTNADSKLLINPKGSTVKERINTPAGYSRVSTTVNSFGNYLQNLKLKLDGSPVHYFDGRIKYNNNVYIAVIDMNIGNKDLQQCADAVMRLRAEYMYQNKMENKIHFTFTNGCRVDYCKWMQGYRIVFAGNKTNWVKKEDPSNTYESFLRYLDLIFTYCGTLSLSRELTKVNYLDLKAGDVLIKGGSPGHAEIVMDVAQNKEGKKVYLLAQSYMPAQETQILTNPNNPDISPWYELSVDKTEIITPEYNFTVSQLMRFKED